MTCKDCVHSHTKGCMLQIDQGTSTEFTSKKGRHTYCFEKISKINPDILTQRRIEAFKIVLKKEAHQ